VASCHLDFMAGLCPGELVNSLDLYILLNSLNSVLTRR